jgi:ribosome-interacting GTPase 1
MARTQKNKATSAHLGSLKAKIAKLKREIIGSTSKSTKGEGKKLKKFKKKMVLTFKNPEMRGKRKC